MIGIGRKKLCDLIFHPETKIIPSNNRQILDSTRVTKLIIDGDYFEKSELGLTIDLIPILNFLVNYVRCIRTFSIKVADTMIANIFRFKEDNPDKYLEIDCSLINSIRTTLFYSIRKKRNQKKIFLTQKYSLRLDYEALDRYKNSIKNGYINQDGVRVDLDADGTLMDFSIQTDVIDLLLLIFRDLVAKNSNERNKLESFIIFINTYYRRIRENSKKHNFDNHKPDPEARKLMRVLEVNVFNIWKELDSRKYSSDEIFQVVKKLEL